MNRLKETKREYTKGTFHIGDNELYEFLFKEPNKAFAFLVYHFLCKSADNERQTSFPSRGTIAANVGICVTSVDLGIDILERHRIIITAKKKGKVTIYLLPNKDFWTLLPVAPLYATYSTYLWDTQVPISSVLTNNTKHSRLYKNAVNKEFTTFKIAVN